MRRKMPTKDPSVGRIMRELRDLPENEASRFKSQMRSIEDAGYMDWLMKAYNQYAPQVYAGMPGMTGGLGMAMYAPLGNVGSVQTQMVPEVEAWIKRNRNGKTD
jgi:hypothetical protein